MDGTRMGSRSSTRHGPAAVFSGPVRRWRKAWAPVSSSSSSAASSSSSSRILLYKWVPLTPGGKDEVSEEPMPQPVRYMPVSIVLAQKKEASRRASEEVDAVAQQSADASGEPEAQADTSDHVMVSTEAPDSAFASEEKAPLADVKDMACSEEKQSKSNSPSSQGDVAMADEAQDQAQDVQHAEEPDELPPPSEEPPQLDLENAEGLSESSPRSQAEG